MNRLLAFLSVLCLLIAGCGGGSGSNDIAPPVTVSVTPSGTSLIAQATQQFAASVTNATSTAVNWSVACPTTACGSIDATGLYRAPDIVPTTTTVTIVATSAAKSTVDGQVTLQLLPASVSVTPDAALTLISMDTKQFTSAVSNVPSGQNGVTWSVVGPGTIDENGLYSAPALVRDQSAVTVSATSAFDSTKTASATITLLPPVISISPTDKAIDAGAQQIFTATVTNVPVGQTSVKWSFTGVGSMQQNVYAAPALVSATTVDVVQAISDFDNSKVAKTNLTISPVIVTVAPETAKLMAAQSYQVTSTVTNHVNKDVSWNLSSTDCSGVGCGTIDASGLYTAPSIVAADMTVSVTATSVADPSKSDSCNLNLVTLLVTVSPETAKVSLNGTQQFSATVDGSTNTAVNWSVSGAGCSGSTCGTITTTGLYTAPSAAPVPPEVTITATSAADAGKSDTASVTLTTDPNLKLSGPYAFQFYGYMADGKSVMRTGRFVADGNGHLTDGRIDINIASAAPILNLPVTGTYHLNADDSRGLLVLTLGESMLAETYRINVNSTGDRGYFIQSEAGIRGFGSFERQTVSDFALTNFNGNYVIAMSGSSVDGLERMAVLGRFSTDGSGAVTDAIVDVTNAGESPQNLSFTATIAFDATTNINAGRGTLTIGITGLGLVDFTFYMVDHQRMFIQVGEGTDSNLPIMAGLIVRQAEGTFSEASFEDESVFYMQGVMLGTPPRSVVQIGEFSADGVGIGRAEYARNWAGLQAFTGGYFDMDYSIAANGRGEWTSTYYYPCVFYMVDKNTGFVMQYDDPATSVTFGYFEPQTASYPFSTGQINGEYLTGQGGFPTTNGVSFTNGYTTFDGTGSYTGVWDMTPLGLLNSNLAMAGSYAMVNTSTGQGLMNQTSPYSTTWAYYIISPTKSLAISLDGAVTNPGLLILEKP
jgi:hypothetical protein